MAVRGGGGSFIKIILVTCVLKKCREIDREHREKAGNLILTRMWPPFISAETKHLFLSDLKNQTIVSLCVTHILPSCGYFKGQEQICFNPTSWHLVTYNFLRGHKF